ncbi:MAG TPA: hypothetical protein VIJ18_14710, partial [Microbacteriaceae bacterium]
GNVGTVSATDSAGNVSTFSNPAWYFGDSGLSIVKAVNAADPQHPTTAEDANTSGPTLPVGSRVVFSYLITNSSGGPMTITGLVDDNGTPSITTDDIALSAMTPLLGADHLHNIGDVNNNGVFDAGETWIFQWATVAKLGGPIVNTAKVAATNGVGQTVTASDIAQYTGLGAHITLHTAVNAVDPLHPTSAEDANTATGPYLQSGSSVVFTYLVTNDGALALTNVVVMDNHGTASTADDFAAKPVLNASGFNVGDLNSNGVLDVGETWLFTSIGAVSPALTAIVGQYLDGSSVTATPSAGPAVTSTDPTYYLGVPAGGILIKKAVNAANPQAPTAAEDANSPASPYYVAVGAAVVFTYLVSSPNGVSIPGSALVITDDNGTPGYTADDFHPVAVTVVYKKVTYNVGDTNHNGILDGTEVWQFTSAGVISGKALAGLHGNIGTVLASVGSVTYASTDPAWYLGVVPVVHIQKATNAADPLHPTVLEDGNDTAHQLTLPIGTPVVWTYLVTNRGTVSVRVVSITDDRGTLSTADDFHPVYVSGDTNNNGLLDPGEIWLYTSAGVVTYKVVAGQYSNTGTVVVSEPRTGAQAHVSDISDHFGATSSITIRKAVNAVDPWHPTVREDANTLGPVLLVGSTATWTYLVTNTGTTSLDITSLTDDGGSADGSQSFEIDQACSTTIPGGGDVNNNGMLDPGETWCFMATGIVKAGPYRNTATVTASEPGQPTPQVSASDVANLVGTVAGISVQKFVNGVAARTASAAVWLAAGSSALFTYLVTSTTTVSLANVTLTDDNGTPDNLADDLTPVYVSGDTNGNGLLDPGEVWLFKATHLVRAGAYNNVVRASGTLTATTPTVTVWSSDINYSFGVVTAIVVDKAVNALDPWHPTTIEDANTLPGKELLVGTSAVWTYLITNTGNTAVTFTSLWDDNGTPTNTADDFAPAPVLVTWNGAQYNAGDANHNGLIDVGETWLFSATTTVTAGAYRNTAAAVVLEPVIRQAATGSDVAGYYGNAGGEGLTPGYWKNHTTLWPAQSNGALIFSPNQLLTSVFSNVPAAQAGWTLLDALSAGGGGVIALFRAAVAGLLSTTSQFISYPQSSTWLIAQVNAVLAAGSATQISNLENTLNGWNNYEANLTPPTVPASVSSAPQSAVVIAANQVVATINAALTAAAAAAVAAALTAPLVQTPPAPLSSNGATAPATTGLTGTVISAVPSTTVAKETLL